MGNNVKKLLGVLVAGALSFSLVSFTACSQTQQEEPAVVESGAVEPEYRTIGKQTDTAIALEVTNATEKDIIGAKITSPQDATLDKTFVTRATKIEASETVLIYLEPLEVSSQEGVASSGSSADHASRSESSSGAASGTATDSGADSRPANDVVLRTLYNVTLTFDDDTTAVLHDLNLEGLTVLSLCLSPDGIAYAELLDEDGKTVSTLETEKALLAAEEEAARVAAEEAAAAQAAAEAQAQAEAEAAAAAAAAATTQNSGGGGGYSYDT